MTDLDLIRRAAALMRERAGVATPGPWLADVLGSEGYAVREDPPIDEHTRPRRRVRVARCGHEDWDTDKANAEYLAAMPPDFLIAVAASLDAAGADLWAYGPLHCADGCMACDDDLWAPHVRCALNVARSYLPERVR